VAVELHTVEYRPGSGGGHCVASGLSGVVPCWPQGGAPVSLKHMVAGLFAVGFRSGAGKLVEEMTELVLKLPKPTERKARDCWRLNAPRRVCDGAHSQTACQAAEGV
jgi:hypothetical protein